MSIVFDQVSYTYGPNAPYQALNQVSCTIELGSFSGIIGHTGSGKSTFLEHINGLKTPSSGKVLINGLDTSNKEDKKEIRKLVGFVAQNPEHQLFAETVFDDIAFGPLHTGAKEEELTSTVEKSLRRLEVEPTAELLASSPFDLSGGQQRRIALAGILAMEPQILAMDEPLAGLDPQGRQQVLKLCQRLNNEGITIVMISHSMDEIAEVADHIIVMNKGELIEHGRVEKIFSEPEKLKRLGLDIPEASKYYFELKKRGVDLGDFVYTLDQLADAIAAYKAGGVDGI